MKLTSVGGKRPVAPRAEWAKQHPLPATDYFSLVVSLRRSEQQAIG
jgi:hypothetical protein